MVNKEVSHKIFGNGKVLVDRGEFVEVNFGGSVRLVNKKEVNVVKEEKQEDSIVTKKETFEKDNLANKNVAEKVVTKKKVEIFKKRTK